MAIYDAVDGGAGDASGGAADVVDPGDASDIGDAGDSGEAGEAGEAGDAGEVGEAGESSEVGEGVVDSEMLGDTMSSDEEDLSDAGEDSRTVFELRCGPCGRLICRRGMKVHLIADSSVQLYSTDFRPVDVVESLGERAHGQCDCRVRDVACACSCAIGYHVIRPCEACSSVCHNNHYWLLDRSGVVVAQPRTNANGESIVWDAEGASVLNDDVPAAPVSPAAAPAPQAEAGGVGDGKLPTGACCPICHEVMVEPRAPPCGHAACQLCLTRAVDLRRACPYCRRPTTCAELGPVGAPCADGSAASGGGGVGGARRSGVL